VKYKSLFLSIMKIVMLAAICIVIYSQASFVVTEWKSNSLKWSEINAGMLILASLGFFLNILLECMKWRQLTGSIEKLSYRRTIGSVLSGIALSIITPQRLGDIVGRLVGFNTNNFPRLIAVQLLGGMIQIAVVLLVGGISLLWLNSHYNWFPLNDYTLISIIVFFLFLILLNIGIFKTRWTIALTNKIPLKGKLKKWLESVHVINTFSFPEITYLYFLTILRYLVYTCQLLLLIEFLGQPALNRVSLGAVYLLFFIQAGVPLPPLFSLVVRGSIALQVWSLIGFPGFRPLIASYLLWLMNLGIPALIGAFNLIYFKKENND
jgi:hypothetical protein